MIISFENEEIRALCEDESHLFDLYKPEVVKQLKNRLSDIESIDFLSEMAVGGVEEIYDNKGIYKVDLIKDEAILTFVLNTPMKSQPIDLNRVNRIKVLGIKMIK